MGFYKPYDNNLPPVLNDFQPFLFSRQYTFIVYYFYPRENNGLVSELVYLELRQPYCRMM